MPADMLRALTHAKFLDLVDIILVAFILYSFFRLIRDTRAYQMAIGLGIVGLLFILTRWGNLVTSHWLIKNFITYLIIAIIVLFQGEIRRLLTGIGSGTIRRPLTITTFHQKMPDLFLAVEYMSQRRIGALIALEKGISLNSFIETGTRVNADLNKDMLVSLFFPHSPLHDGAVIIQGDRIAAAGCLLPLPASHNLGEEFQTQTRHLAALGLSQETDAAVVVVSEQTGTVSVAIRGKIEKMAGRDELKNRLMGYFKK
ncbi:MAG: TIGR00159 family protein [Candidatus Aminicenantes bacterium RBG_13_63_10]|nr:MAG: TIGR00159 family protein [Candidatus Aminicenantes bacterium RBG_13_63_10]